MHNSPQLTKYIHENFWIVMSFAFAAPKYANLLELKFRGEWKYLWKEITDAEKRANRALLELGVQLRVLDDAEELAEYFKQLGSPTLGMLTKSDDTEEALYFRDCTNKILHSKGFRWVLDDTSSPIVIAESANKSRWKEAQIELCRLAGVVGQMMH